MVKCNWPLRFLGTGNVKFKRFVADGIYIAPGYHGNCVRAQFTACAIYTGEADNGYMGSARFYSITTEQRACFAAYLRRLLLRARRDGLRQLLHDLPFVRHDGYHR